MLFVLRIENCVLRKKEKEKIQKQNNIEKQERLLFFSLSYCPTNVGLKIF